MLTRQLYLVGCGLGVVGSLVVLVSLVAAGHWSFALVALGVGCGCALALKNTFERDDFDRDHSISIGTTRYSTTP